MSIIIFFYAVVYGLMYCKSNGGNVFLENAEETLGDELFIELKKIEKSTMLNHSIFGFFDPCKLINDVLCEYGFFLRFYERRNEFRYQLKQKLNEKNQMKRELSACIVQMFNGYELLRNHLNLTERKNFILIDIVCEPTLNEKKPIVCFFAPEVSLGYYTSYDKMRKRKKVTDHTRARQSHYCNNFFIKSAEKMQRHLSCCAGKAGFTFSFDNEKIIDYQDHYKNLGDLPFTDQKVLGLYEVEHIDDPCYMTLVVNPKEYFEYFKSELINKKHKGIKKGSNGMEYKNYAERIKP